MKKISVIIPVYNASLYLEKCLNSILTQSLKEIEIICVNDGSTDDSLEILKKFQKKDNRIIIVNKENGGVSKARNDALKLATGEYCLNIDSDDWVEQDFLENMYLKAQKYNLDLLISDIILDYGNKIKIRKEVEIGDDRILSGKEYRQIFFDKNFIAQGYTCNKLIKTKFYKNYSIFYNENISFLEDYELILKLAFYLERIGKINKAYYHYVQREESTSRNIKNNEKNFLQGSEVFNNLEKFYEDKDKEIFLKIKREKIFSMQYSIFKEKDVSEKMYKKYLSEVRKEKFILKKYQGEKLKQIFLFNIIKLFKLKLIVKLIKKIV